jgi:outer membrane PBP1 activator LpoA protein
MTVNANCSCGGTFNRLLAIALVAGAVAGCTTTEPAESVAYRQERLAEDDAVREWRACRDQTVALDEQARATASAARHLASARMMLETCEGLLVPRAARLVEDERMRAHALAIQSAVLGGDIAMAGDALQFFQTRFPGADLYFADGASFIETAEMLTGNRDRSAVAQFATVNIGQSLAAELRRLHYWRSH